MNGIVKVKQNQITEFSEDDVLKQVNKIQNIMHSVMKKDEHYGQIPGTNKPTLFKAGAEKLCFTFRLSPFFEIDKTNLPNDHREYEIICTLKNVVSGQILAQGVGSCSSMEKKYRYRKSSNNYEKIDTVIPDDYKQKKDEYRKKGFGCKQEDGQWVWVKYTQAEQIENPDIADIYNTVLKMAKKRAFVDATISACAASDIFTQDMEDFKNSNNDNKQETPKDVEKQELIDKANLLANKLKLNYKQQQSIYNINDMTLTQIANVIDILEKQTFTKTVKDADVKVTDVDADIKKEKKSKKKDSDFPDLRQEDVPGDPAGDDPFYKNETID